MFSHINNPAKFEGTYLGTKIHNYVDHINKYNLSKELISEAQIMERAWVRKFSNFLMGKFWRYRYNYLLKGIVLFSFCRSAVDLQRDITRVGIIIIKNSKIIQQCK